MGHERRVVFRVDRAEWKTWDDKRHGQRESWQSLAYRLFTEWYTRGIQTEREKNPVLSSTKLEYTAAEAPIVERVLRVARSSPVARAALISLLDLAEQVRERAGEPKPTESSTTGNLSPISEYVDLDRQMDRLLKKGRAGKTA